MAQKGMTGLSAGHRLLAGLARCSRLRHVRDEEAESVVADHQADHNGGRREPNPGRHASAWLTVRSWNETRVGRLLCVPRRGGIAGPCLLATTIAMTLYVPCVRVVASQYPL